MTEHDPRPHSPVQPHQREPMFNIPFVPLIVAVGLVALYAMQGQLPDDGLAWGLRPIDLQHGHYSGLLTHMVVHGSWAHVLMNALGLIAFGSPVARDLSRGLGPAAWLAFFIIGGVFAGGVYALIHWGNAIPVVGASGAVFAMIGASLRLMAGPCLLIPLFHPVVMRGAFVWMAVNAVTGIFGGLLTGDGAAVAWEAHAAGFVAGIILVGPFHRFFGVKYVG
ncbi:rhomboid family intramembrane serine protease [uncultured Brevundimonas sp.]|uniref:rhomboid family intramembrane serine protease n=1 Tax=uncultured Brevundimonas sp. TaxID=213418 RepID=UPI002618547F|nr:rhomboid family intramembrane serine protease [uncultured Brevundimonas sp.]